MIQVEYNPHRKHSIKVRQPGKETEDYDLFTRFYMSFHGKHGWKFAKGGDLLLKANSTVFTYIMKFFNSNLQSSHDFIDAMDACVGLQAEMLGGQIKNADISLDKSPKYKSKLPLMQHQRYGIEFALNLPCSALLWEMGTGKTATAIIVARERLKKNEIDKVLVIAPLSILRNWVKEVEKFTDLIAVTLEGAKKRKLETLSSSFACFFIMNYESLLSLSGEHDFEHIINDRTMVITDESSKFKNHQAKRTGILYGIASRTKYRMIMSGTPITQGAADIYSQFSFLANFEMFPLSFDGYAALYFRSYGYTLKPKHEALEKIAEKVYTISTRFLRAECLELPEKTYLTRDVILTGKQNKLYYQMLEQCIAEIEEMTYVTATIILTKILRLSQITSGHIKTESGDIVRFVPSAKLKEVTNIIEEAGDGIQVVIWSRFIADFADITRLCKEKGWAYSSIHGGIDPLIRQSEVDRFQAGSSRVFIGNPQSGGFGIELFSLASPPKSQIVIYYTNSYSYGDRIQSEDRNHRKGQKHPVTYIDLVAHYTDSLEYRHATIDKTILKVLQGKKNMASIITKDNVRELLDLR